MARHQLTSNFLIFAVLELNYFVERCLALTRLILQLKPPSPEIPGCPFCHWAITLMPLELLKSFELRLKSHATVKSSQVKSNVIKSTTVDLITFDLTWLHLTCSGMWLESTSNDSGSSEIMMNLRDTSFFAQIDNYHAQFTIMACISFTVMLYRLQIAGFYCHETALADVMSELEVCVR